METRQAEKRARKAGAIGYGTASTQARQRWDAMARRVAGAMLFVPTADGDTYWQRAERVAAARLPYGRYSDTARELLTDKIRHLFVERAMTNMLHVFPRRPRPTDMRYEGHSVDAEAVFAGATHTQLNFDRGELGNVVGLRHDTIAADGERDLADDAPTPSAEDLAFPDRDADGFHVDALAQLGGHDRLVIRAALDGRVDAQLARAAMTRYLQARAKLNPEGTRYAWGTYRKAQENASSTLAAAAAALRA